MQFLSVLTLATALIRYQERVSCRTLKRVFELDDDALADLQHELVEVQGVAVEKDGGVLAWAGEQRVRPEVAAPQREPSEPVPDTHRSGPAGLPPAVRVVEPVIGDAERRQLTVMFCDLAGSTRMSAQLDPEDLQDVIRAYQDAATGAIRAYHGFLAKYMGDGILAYFGYPQALGNDAESAVRAGLEIVDAVAGLKVEVGRSEGVELAVRIGIATGIVVVGDVIGEGEAQERAVVGETPNLAARLQELAEPNGIVIGSVTKDLAGDPFVYEDQGAHEIRASPAWSRSWGYAA